MNKIDGSYISPSQSPSTTLQLQNMDIICGNRAEISDVRIQMFPRSILKVPNMAYRTNEAIWEEITKDARKGWQTY